MDNLKILTYKDIQEISPCYDSIKYLKTAEWKGTVIDILNIKECPANDRVWAATRLLDDKTNRLFAVSCARYSLKFWPNPDERSVNAINVAERYALNKATKDELIKAESEACKARSAVRSAAWSATLLAAESAAESAWAAVDSARSAARAAVDSARSAAEIEELAAYDELINELRKIILNNQL